MRSARPAADLVILAGAGAGLRQPLAAGAHALRADAARGVVPARDAAARAVDLELSAAAWLLVPRAPGVRVEGAEARVGARVVLGPGDAVLVGDALLALLPPGAPLPAPPAPEAVGLPAPEPAEPPRAPLPLAPSLVPAAGGAVLYATTGQPAMLALAALGPAAALGGAAEDGVRRRRRRRRAEAGHAAARAEEARRADAAVRAEARRRRAAQPGPLGHPAPAEDDAWAVRLGVADAPAASAPARAAPHVPVVLDVAREPVLALVGPRADVAAAARAIVLDAAGAEPPAAVVVLAAPGREAAWAWASPLATVTAPEDAFAALPSGAPRALVVADGPAGAEGARAWAAAAPGRLALLLGDAAAPARLVLGPDRRGTLATATTTVAGILPDLVPAGLARALAGRRAPGPERGEAPSPTLADLHGLPETGLAAAVHARWATPAPGLPWRLGATPDGGAVACDLAADGPHALVAGTTGSGKSVLLQGLVAGLALALPPTRVAFVLVDFKGGSAFAPLVDLPHVAALVTDLDDGLVLRAVDALGGELRRREALLLAAGAPDLAALAARDPDAAPPALVVVVDELAALVRQAPGALDALVDLAQRGRSLGLHLVLATQRPGGVVSPQVRANAALRVALRVEDEADAVDVVGDAAAARLPRRPPGRGLLRLDGERPAAFAGPAPASIAGAVAAVLEAAGGVGRAPAPWPPPLPARVPVEPGGDAVGLVDRPEHQRQEPLRLDLATDGGLLVTGPGGAGRTTALRAAVLALAATRGPADLAVHAIDAGGAGLAPLAALPQVGTVARLADLPAVLRLLRHVAAEAERRRSAGGGRATALVVDGLPELVAVVERAGHGALLEEAARGLADGRALGLHLLASAGRSAGLPPLLAAAAGARIELGGTPGRGRLADGAPVQVADADADAVAAAAAEARRRHPGTSTVPVAPLPPRVDGGTLPTGSADAPTLGLGEDGLVALPLAPGHVLVAGPLGSGRSGALRGLAARARAAGLAVEAVAARPGAWPSGVPVHVGADAAADALRRLAALAAATPAACRLVLVDDADVLCEEAAAADALARLLRAGRTGGTRVVAAGERRALRRAFGGPLADLRAEGRALLLRPDRDVDGDLVGIRLGRGDGVPEPPGRGVLVDRGLAVTLQVALP